MRSEVTQEDLASVSLGSEGKLVCSAHSVVCMSWCEHMQRVLQAGADSIMLHTDHHIIVPIFPTADVWVEVWIGEDIGNGSAIMSMSYTPDIGKPYSVWLGFWNPGEGMNTIRLVILDYLKSKIDPKENFDAGPIKTKCPATIHGMKESRMMATNSADPKWKWRCLWSIVMEKACLPCAAASSSDDFGMSDPNDFNTRPPWSI